MTRSSQPLTNAMIVSTAPRASAARLLVCATCSAAMLLGGASAAAQDTTGRTAAPDAATPEALVPETRPAAPRTQDTGSLDPGSPDDELPAGAAPAGAAPSSAPTADDGVGDGGPDGHEQEHETDGATWEEIDYDSILAEFDDELQLRLVRFGWTPERIARMSGSAALLDEQELGRFQHNDVHSIVTRVPGVYVRGEDGFGLRPNIGMRGANSDRSKKITLMEDGILFGPAPYSAPAAYYFPLMARIVGLEVFKGPAAVMFGPNTIGGALNFVTRTIPDELDAGVDLSWGMYNTARLHGWVGGSNDWGGLLLEAAHIQSDGFKDIDFSDRHTGFSLSEFTLAGQVHTDEYARIVHRLEVRAGYSREASNETYLGLTAADYADDPRRRYIASDLDRMEWWRTSARATYRMEIDDDAEFSLTAYRHDLDRSWRKLDGFRSGPDLFAILRDPSGQRRLFHDILRGAEDSVAPEEALILGTNARRFVSQGVQALGQAIQEGGTWTNEIQAGVRLHYDSIRRNHTADAWLMQQQQLVPEGTDTVTTTLNTGETLALAMHVHDQFTIGSLTIAPGLRVEHIRMQFEDDLAGTRDDLNQTVALPGIGVHYELLDGLGVLAGAHRGFSPVTPGQGGEVRPETSVNYEAGVRYAQPDEGTLAEVVGFYNAYSNLLANCGFSSCGPEQQDDLFNGGRVDVFGLEVLGAHVFRTGGALQVPARLAYTYTHGRFRDSFSSENPQFGDVEAGFELPYLPRHQLAVQVGLEAPTWGVDVAGTVIDSMLEQAGTRDDDAVLRTDAYLNLDARVYYNLPANVQLYVRGENLLNAQPVVSRRPYGERPLRPLLVMVGAQWRLR